MRRVEASAPGKAVIIGEYAVLHGAPALVLAVDRRVRVTISSGPPDVGHLEIPQLTSEPVEFAIESPGRIRWRDGRADRPELALCRNLLSRAIKQSDISALPGPDGLQVRIDSGELYLDEQGGPIKLGLGSSAAVTVALQAALERYFRPSASEASPQLAELLQAHRREQGGRGSGLDLAAALAGGLLVYRLVEDRPELQLVDWPDDWPLLFVWTGRAASTGRFLDAYERWRAMDPSAAASLQQAMDCCAREAVACVKSADLAPFMTCINNYRGLMGRIGAGTQVEVLSPQHQRLAGIARDFGAAYKPCGAGGGDLGMFVLPDEARLDELRSSIAASGFRQLELRPAITGLQLAITDNI